MDIKFQLSKFIIKPTFVQEIFKGETDGIDSHMNSEETITKRLELQKESQ